MRNYLPWYLTTIWILIVLILMFVSESNLTKLGLNEWGSFLSGCMAGLAYIWIIFGYYQQNAELKINNELLKQQKIEFENQVTQTASIANSAREQFNLQYDISLKPILLFHNKGQNEKGIGHWMLTNVGNGPAISVTIAEKTDCSEWDSGTVHFLSSLPSNNGRIASEKKNVEALIAIYSDVNGKEYSTLCENNRNSLFTENIEPALFPNSFEYQKSESNTNL